jgi:flagellar hook-associated protein 3 FlgL
MQISTNQFYTFNQNSMRTLGATADDLQTQISTTHRINAPSDDAVSWRRLQGLASATADDTAFGGNLTLVGTTLSQADGTLSSITDALQQAKELAVKANSGTLSASDRVAIADQLDAIVTNLVSYANVKDSRGAAVFANGDADAVTKNADGTFNFAATGPTSIPVGANETIQPGDSAARVFVDASGGNILSTISSLSAALRGSGNVSAIAGSAGDALQAANDQAASVQAGLGARAARVDLETSRLKDVATDREAARSALEDTDVTATITNLQKTMTVLQATQASFTKLASMSLFNFLK